MHLAGMDDAAISARQAELREHERDHGRNQRAE